MEVNFSEFEEWCTPEITEGECGDCGDCEGEDTSLFLRFICAYMNCEENKHAGKLVATLNKTPRQSVGLCQEELGDELGADHR